MAQGLLIAPEMRTPQTLLSASFAAAAALTLGLAGMPRDAQAVQTAQGVQTAPAVQTAQAPSLAEVEVQAAAESKLESRRTAAVRDRAALDRRYQEQVRAIARLKATRRSFGQDDELRRKLRTARDLAEALDRGARALAELDAKLGAARRSLVAAAVRELGSAPSPERRAALERIRDLAIARGGGRDKLRVVDEAIDPADGPEDLEAKARALAASEAGLRKEIALLDRRAGYLHRQDRLTRARARADEQDIFGDETARRRVGSGAARLADVSGAAGAPEHSAEPPALAGDTDNATTFTEDPGRGVPEGGGGLPGASDATPLDPAVYADVVEPATLHALARADRAGDPASQAAAAEQARKDLAVHADHLALRRAELERRARLLRAADR